jgi:hypothetical protein
MTSSCCIVEPSRAPDIASPVSRRPSEPLPPGARVACPRSSQPCGGGQSLIVKLAGGKESLRSGTGSSAICSVTARSSRTKPRPRRLAMPLQHRVRSMPRALSPKDRFPARSTRATASSMSSSTDGIWPSPSVTTRRSIICLSRKCWEVLGPQELLLKGSGMFGEVVPTPPDGGFRLVCSARWDGGCR